MTEENFHFEMTTDDVPLVPDLSDMEFHPAKAIVDTLFKAVGIQPGAATVTLGSEQKQDN